MKLLKNKKIIFAAVLVAVVVVTLIQLSKKVDKEKQKEPGQFIKPPVITNHFDDNYKIELNTTPKDFSFPEKLPYLRQDKSRGFTKTEIDKISANLGFSGDLIEFDDVKYGKLYIWNGEKSSLFIYSEINKIKLAPSYDPTDSLKNIKDKQITDNEYVIFGKDFLVQNFDLDSEKIKFSNFVYLRAEKGLELFNKTTQNQAQITQVNFYYSDAQYPAYSENAQDTQIYVQFTKDGEILNAELSLFSEYKPTEIEYNIKNHDDIEKTLDQSTIVNINNSNINLPDLDSDVVKEVKIENIQLIYLPENREVQIVQPGFLLEGTASIKGFINKLPITLFLPAFSNK